MGSNILAAIDPRAKWAAFLAVQALLFIPGSRPPQVRLTAVALPLLALLPFAGRSWRRWLRLLALAASLLVILSASAYLQPGGDRPEPQQVILPMLGKYLLAFLSLALFVLNETPWRLLQGLRQAGLPRTFAVVLTIGYRFAGQWRLELEALRRAWTARNIATLSKLSKARTLGGALPQFFERLLESSVHVHDAMASRGFHGSLPAWRRLHFRRLDAIFLLLTAAATAVITLAA